VAAVVVALAPLRTQALTFGPCVEAGQEAFECATLPVPLDYLTGAGTIVVAPAAGRSLLALPCAQVVLERFVRGEDPGDACASNEAPVPVQPLPPTSLRALPASNVEGRPGRTLTAVQRTIRDAIAASSAVPSGTDVPGVRHGKASVEEAANSSRWTFQRYTLVPGVQIDGELAANGGPLVGRITVRGSEAAHGQLDFAAGRITGTLGGVPIAMGAEPAPVLQTRQRRPLMR